MNPDAIRRLLATNRTLGGLDPDYLQTLAVHARVVEVGGQESIFRQFTPADHFYVVLQGAVSVEIPAIYGGPLSMQEVKAGDVLGWSWLVPPYQWHFDARALGPTKLLEIDGRLVRDLCEKDARLGFELLKRFCALMLDRLQSSRSRMLDVIGPEIQ